MDMHKIDHSFDREVDVTLSTVTLVIDLIFDFFATPTFSENQKPDSNKQLTLTSNSLIYIRGQLRVQTNNTLNLQ